jgi:tRNA A37 threonylcarbamoyltransferase TsaD
VDFLTARLYARDRNAPRPTSEGLLPPDVARRVDFSFSGLKTAVLRPCASGPASISTAAPRTPTVPAQAVGVRDRRHLRQLPARRRRGAPDRTFEAARWLGARSVGIAGGVSANSRLRSEAEVRAGRAGIPVRAAAVAPTDNAAAIGAADTSQPAAPPWDFNAEASLPPLMPSSQLRADSLS